MRTITAKSLFLFILVTGFIWLVTRATAFDLYPFYADNLRASLFSGFLTIGGLLLSLKTFIIVKLKEDLFDHPEYRKRYEANRNINKNKVGMIYDPLYQLSDFLIVCVFGSIISATLQFTLGFINCSICPAICIASAFTSVVVVLTACWEVKLNLSRLFELLEAKEQERYKDDD